MGRRRKYFNDEERKIANNDKVKQFYWRNKSDLDKKSKAYYWRKKIESLIKDGNLQKAEIVKQKALLKGIDIELLTVDNHDNKQ